MMPPLQIRNDIQDNIADTLYIPLYVKCRETMRNNPFFRDPTACEMLRNVGYDFSKYEKAVRSSVGVAIRAKYFDEFTATFIQTHRNPIIVIIGCGLDAHYQKLGQEIRQKAVFYELDIPVAIQLREKLLPPCENDIYLQHSMFETDWMSIVKLKTGAII
jgi:O-methyltransferase involved in polyketide biosynthesis